MKTYRLNKIRVICLLLLCCVFFIGTYQYYRLHYKLGYYEDITTIEDKAICDEFIDKVYNTSIDSVVEYPKNVQNETKNMLDGCYHVYVDVGSNIGVQIRKLFEPEKYPKASVHSIFNSHFGTAEERQSAFGGREVCAVGFEPNSHHTQYLQEVESSYNKCGWRVKFMTETGASGRNGTTRFYTDEAYGKMEWGGGILSPDVNNIAIDNVANKEKPKFMDVTLVRLSDFLKNIVGTRKLPVAPSKSHPPQIVMKMDIEGSEVDVMSDLIFTGGLQYINKIMVEWHKRLEKLPERQKAQQQLESITKLLGEYSKTMQKQGGKFEFILINLDDETYLTSKFDLPKCNITT